VSGVFSGRNRTTITIRPQFAAVNRDFHVKSVRLIEATFSL